MIIIFDCDMEAHGDFLAHTLPFLANGPLTALVQVRSRSLPAPL